MDKAQVLRRFEKLSEKDRKKALRIINKNMSLANRKHDLAILVGFFSYASLSDIRMNDIEEAVRKGGA